MPTKFTLLDFQNLEKVKQEYFFLFFLYLFFYFFLMWAVLSGPPLFRPSKIYISLSHINIIWQYCKMAPLETDHSNLFFLLALLYSNLSLLSPSTTPGSFIMSPIIFCFCQSTQVLLFLQSSPKEIGIAGIRTTDLIHDLKLTP